MYHSVSFDGANTYTRWHLVPQGIPIIALPEQKKQTVEVPGGNGVLDLSLSLTKYPVFNRRTGEINFTVLDGYDTQTIRTNLVSYLHGQRRKMILEDDPDYYYYGYYAVIWTHNNDGTMPTVTIAYDLEPYKYANDITYSDGATGAYTTITQNSTILDMAFNESSSSITLPTPFIIQTSTVSGNAKVDVGYSNTYLGITTTMHQTDSSGAGIVHYGISKANTTYVINQYQMTSRGSGNTGVSHIYIDRSSLFMPSGGSMKLRVGYRRALL